MNFHYKTKEQGDSNTNLDVSAVDSMDATSKRLDEGSMVHRDMLGHLCD